jgi:RNA polymerase sigma-70 factor (ECF subfamily)
VERAVVVLREVFDYDDSEITGAAGKDETHCLQILRRARQHIGEMRPRFHAPQ